MYRTNLPLTGPPRPATTRAGPPPSGAPMTTPLTGGAGEQETQQEIPEEIRTVERLRALREQVITQMGGPAAVGAIHAAGRRTAREHIAGFVDPGSFGEIGTFATFVDKVTAPDPGPYGGGII